MGTLKKKIDLFTPVTQSEENIGLHREKLSQIERVLDVHSLDKLLSKHVSRLEREVQEVKNKRKIDPIEGGGMVTLNKNYSFSLIKHFGENVSGKENIDLTRKLIESSIHRKRKSK